jgi:hypothetical protein
VDRAGDQLLAHAALARHQHIARRAGAPRNLLEQGPHHGALADHAVRGRRPEQRALLQAGAHGRVAEVERAPHPQVELVEADGLFEIVAGAATEGEDCGLKGGERGHQDDHGPRVQQLRLFQHVEAAQPRHHDVGEDEVEVLLFDARQGLLAAPGRGHAVSLGRERAVQHPLHPKHVVHYENRCAHNARHTN